MSGIGQENYYVQAENHLDYLILKKRLKIWRRMGGWFNIRQCLQNDNIFLCHNSNIGTWWLRQSGRICNGQTHLVKFLLALFITFSWIWMKPPSFSLRASKSFLGEDLKPDMKKNAETQFFQQQYFGLGSQQVWMVQCYLWKRGKLFTLGLEVPTWSLYTYMQKDLVWSQTKDNTWMMRLGKMWWNWQSLLLEK